VNHTLYIKRTWATFFNPEFYTYSIFIVIVSISDFGLSLIVSNPFLIPVQSLTIASNVPSPLPQRVFLQYILLQVAVWRQFEPATADSIKRVPRHKCRQATYKEQRTCYKSCNHGIFSENIFAPERLYKPHSKIEEFSKSEPVAEFAIFYRRCALFRTKIARVLLSE
jgi:hypothetical protein